MSSATDGYVVVLERYSQNEERYSQNEEQSRGDRQRIKKKQILFPKLYLIDAVNCFVHFWHVIIILFFFFV